MSIYNIQSLLQGTETLALKVVDRRSGFHLIIYYGLNPCALGIEFACERLIAILYSNGITAFRVGRDVDVEANDVACIDGFLIDDFACFVSNVYEIGIVERIEIDTQLLVVVFAIYRLFLSTSLTRFGLCLDRTPKNGCLIVISLKEDDK